MKESKFTLKLKLTITVLAIFYLGLSFAQNRTYSVYNDADSLYGKSELLVNGPLYFQPNRLAKGTPYLVDENFSIGNIYISGRKFENNEINFDISEQKLLLLITTKYNQRLVISLSESMVDSFDIQNRLFVSNEIIGIDKNYSYLEKLNSGKDVMVIGYSKNFINQYNQTNPQGKYSKLRRSIYINTNSNFTEIKSKTNLLEYYPENKKQISTFLRKSKINISDADPKDLKTIINYCNSLNNE